MCILSPDKWQIMDDEHRAVTATVDTLDLETNDSDMGDCAH